MSTCINFRIYNPPGFLLQNLCDRINRIGEIGYFLTSFEAAIAHIQEIDLTEDREDMLSFLSVPLTEVSLNDDD
jgi:hypothetical protein